MTVRFVLINVRLGKRKHAYQSLIKIPEIKELHTITGEYNIIVRIDDDRITFSHIIDDIRNIEGVTRIKFLGVVVDL